MASPLEQVALFGAPINPETKESAKLLDARLIDRKLGEKHTFNGCEITEFAITEQAALNRSVHTYNMAQHPTGQEEPVTNTSAVLAVWGFSDKGRCAVIQGGDMVLAFTNVDVHIPLRTDLTKPFNGAGMTYDVTKNQREEQGEIPRVHAARFPMQEVETPMAYLRGKIAGLPARDPFGVTSGEMIETGAGVKLDR